MAQTNEMKTPFYHVHQWINVKLNFQNTKPGVENKESIFRKPQAPTITTQTPPSSAKEPYSTKPNNAALPID